jgi:cytochrome c oxidase subunit 3
MSAVTTPPVDQAHDNDAHSHELPYWQQLRANRLGLWLFLISELFLFVGLFVSRFYLWRDEAGHLVRPELDQVAALFATMVLLISSYFMVRAEVAIQHGEQKKMLNSLMGTFIMGFLFLLSVVLVEWGVLDLILENTMGVKLFSHEAIKPTDGAFGAVFYGMTGMHALHVVSGLFLIWFMWRNGRKGKFTEEQHWGIEACAIYWHYVDVIWIFFYPALYLIGRGVLYHT